MSNGNRGSLTLKAGMSKYRNVLHRLALKATVALILFLIGSAHAVAGEWRVLPLGLELKKNIRSGVFTVINEGAEPVHFQVSAVEWNQNDSGKEIYSPTGEILFSPKIVKIPPAGQQVIRVGYQGPFPQREKTYRLFIKEIPGPKKKGEADSRFQVSIALQFATPIFVKPVLEQLSGRIERIWVERGELNISVRNTGNTHLRIESLSARGLADHSREVFSKEVKGWYVLNGKTSKYKVQLSAEECKQASVIELEAKAESLTLKETVKVDKDFCMP